MMKLFCTRVTWALLGGCLEEVRVLCVEGSHGLRAEKFRVLTASEHLSLTARDTQRGGLTRLRSPSKLAAEPALDLGQGTHCREA